MRECDGPYQPYFDDPTWYCPLTGEPVDDDICRECELAYELHIERMMDRDRETTEEES